jgi:hypothetical protein
MIPDIDKVYLVYSFDGEDHVDYFHLTRLKCKCIGLGNDEYEYNSGIYGISKIYVKVISGFKYIHRSGGLPALIFSDGRCEFYEYGHNKMIEDLTTNDDYDKVILKLKYHVNDISAIDARISYTGKVHDDLR